MIAIIITLFAVIAEISTFESTAGKGDQLVLELIHEKGATLHIIIYIAESFRTHLRYVAKKSL